MESLLGKRAFRTAKDKQRYTYRVLQTIQVKPIFYVLCVWAERAILGSAKTALKVNEITHDLTFYCIYNQMCMPQYKVNV